MSRCDRGKTPEETMPQRAPGSPSEVVSWSGDQPVVFASSHSPPLSSVQSNPSTMEDGVIIVPARGTETPITRAKMPGISGCTSPEVRLKIGSVSPETARRVAVGLYGRLRQHGLDMEAEKVFRDEKKRREEARGVVEEERKRKEEELMGMNYLLRDGFVSYLRDVTKITPPIPRQVYVLGDI